MVFSKSLGSAVLSKRTASSFMRFWVVHYPVTYLTAVTAFGCSLMLGYGAYSLLVNPDIYLEPVDRGLPRNEKFKDREYNKKYRRNIDPCRPLVRLMNDGTLELLDDDPFRKL
ncbi:uncharacterized protein DEA37_0005393 [Paragonimus westermani]|uniref:Uncharacterized protein n=1 Tax=Paragonimus westermani TaxID=34504 RepID=A0A5J4N9H8_9TREM|nr:uncharacterized protein DEA37_0005393 [Paragonimus westermani]